MKDGRPSFPARIAARLTTTQIMAGLAAAAAVALGLSLYLASLAVRADARETAAFAALQDYASMISKLGEEERFSLGALGPSDLTWLAAWMEAFQARPGQAVTLATACAGGRGGAGVRLVQAPGRPPVGSLALAEATPEPLAGLGEGLYLLRLERGTLCPNRAVEVVAVRRIHGDLALTVGRVADRRSLLTGWTAAAVIGMGAAILLTGLAAAAIARRRMSAGIARISQALDRASVGDFTLRAPENGLAPELTALGGRVNRTLDRLEELLGWLRDTSDQMAHDFRTPLARASARLERLSEGPEADEAARLIAQARHDLSTLNRAMSDAIALRDGEAWTFETVRLDVLVLAVAELYQPVAEARGVRIETKVEPVGMLGVHSLLQRAVANLVDNAVKFSPDGGVVRLTAGVRQGRPVLTVADQGPGMGKTPDDTAAGPESHGMGLPFVRAVVRRHGGALINDDGAPGTVVTAKFWG